MYYFPLMHKILVLFEFIAVIIGVLYFAKLKHTHWKWFVVYLMIIFLQELIWTFDLLSLEINSKTRNYYYTFIGIPIQYIFLYWLIAYKSLKRKRLFYLFTVIYMLTFTFVKYYLKDIILNYDLNLTVGTLLLSYLVVMEFKKQIDNDNILKYKENKMFYITIGVTLFYIGTYPFFAFIEILKQPNYHNIYNLYYIYYLVSNYLLYLFFSASILWGKVHSN